MIVLGKFIKRTVRKTERSFRQRRSLQPFSRREANSEWIEQRVGQKWQGNRDVGVIQRLLCLTPNEDEWQLLASKRD